MISWAMDLIDRMVNPKKYDIHSITNNRYGQWDEKEDTMAIKTALTPGQIAGLGQITAQQNYLTTNANVIYGAPAQGLGGYIYNQSGVGIINIPSPIGCHFTVYFVDAAGQGHHMVVDQAYLGILHQIGMQHQANNPYITQMKPYTPSPVPAKMVDGEFSLDEMDQAESIIMELENAN